MGTRHGRLSISELAAAVLEAVHSMAGDEIEANIPRGMSAGSSTGGRLIGVRGVASDFSAGLAASRSVVVAQRHRPMRFVTDTLGSYRVAHRVVMRVIVHDTGRCANDRAEVSHQPMRQRERRMRRFKSAAQVQSAPSSPGFARLRPGEAKLTTPL